MIAALYVDPHGPYVSMPDVDAWTEERDARKYDGPHAVVAHPPCERWGRYWSGGPSARTRLKLGDDSGCFAHALASVLSFGGVLEHPEGSHAFRAFGLRLPRWREGWTRCSASGGWVCCVAQGNYGHRSRKLTWLFANAPREALPELDWSVPPPAEARLDDGFHSATERAARARRVKRGTIARLTKYERRGTPPAFAAILVAIASAVRP